jgi:hypothetical protein
MTELDPNTYVPTWTDEDVKRDAQQDRITHAGLYQVIVTNKENKFSKGLNYKEKGPDGKPVEDIMKKGRPLMELTMVPLAEENKGNTAQYGYKLRNYIVTPFPAEGVELPTKPQDIDDDDTEGKAKAKEFWTKYESKTKQFSGLMENSLRNLLGESKLPARPRKFDGHWHFAGDVIEESQVAACHEKMSNMSKEIGKKVWLNELNIADTNNPVACYVEIELKGEYPEIKRMHAEKPADKKLIPFHEWGQG